jgi:hypothetical protein
MDKIKKLLGWVIFFVGLAIIFWAILNSYNIFTGKSQAPNVFKIAEEEITTPATKGKTPTTEEELQKELQNAMTEQLKGMIPADTLPKLLNLISWSIFATILFFGGAQIAGLGIRLMKS